MCRSNKQVDVGGGEFKALVAGLKKYYSVEELEGRLVVTIRFVPFVPGEIFYAIISFHKEKRYIVVFLTYSYTFGFSK